MHLTGSPTRIPVLQFRCGNSFPSPQETGDGGKSFWYDMWSEVRDYRFHRVKNQEDIPAGCVCGGQLLMPLTQALLLVEVVGAPTPASHWCL